MSIEKEPSKLLNFDDQQYFKILQKTCFDILNDQIIDLGKIGLSDIHSVTDSFIGILNRRLINE